MSDMDESDSNTRSKSKPSPIATSGQGSVSNSSAPAPLKKTASQATSSSRFTPKSPKSPTQDSDGDEDLNDYGDDDFDDQEDDGEYDDDDLDMGNSGVFSPVVAEKDRRKVHEVEFTVHKVEDIIKVQKDEADQVAGLLGTAPQHAATLLRYFRWNKERLIDRYFADPAATAIAAGVILDSAKQPRPITVPGFACDVCCADEPDLLSIALSCGHRFCTGCYGQYLTTKVRQEGESRRIQCMQKGCGVIVDEKTVEQCVDKAVLEK
ncbi:hypothetical protein HDU93_008770 [Gonapodya sp. JEL0774]|nr:hypothetical protein HDU93_008770 [Gonapodya sp. JEL0774]